MMNSDETVAYSGFLALWEALPLKTCENKTIRGVNSGFIQSPGYPDEESTWFEPPLDCWTFITAPGKNFKRLYPLLFPVTSSQFPLFVSVLKFFLLINY